MYRLRSQIPRACFSWALLLTLLHCAPPAGPAAAPAGEALPPSTLSLSPAGPRIAQGTGQRFTVRATFADGHIRDVAKQLDWSVLDEQGRPVAGAAALPGLITLERPGLYRVRASSLSRLVETTITVTTAVVKSVALGPVSPSIALGTHQQFTLTATFSDGTTQDVTALSAWSVKTVTGTGVATVDSAGLASGKAVGTARITGRYSGKTSSTVLTVTPAVMTSIAVTPADPTITKGASQQFTATAAFSDGTHQDITALADWSVQDVVGMGVADIDEFGDAVGLSVGKVLVSADYNGLTGSTTMTVSAGPALTSLSVTPTTATIGKTMTQKFVAVATFADGSTQDVSTTAVWSTSDVMGTGIATVDGTGLATGKSEGVCWVTAAYRGLSSHAVLTVSSGLHALSTGTTQVLWGVWGSSASDVWAVGGAGTVLHFDGSTVSAPTTLAGTTGMNAVWGSGAHDVWFAGDSGLLLHYDGAAFTSQTLSPAPESITGLWGSSASSIWAATTEGPYHYDGTSWTQLDSGIAAAGQTAVWGSGASDVWFFEDGAIDHWNGTALSKSAMPAAASIYGSSGTGAHDVWAVGTAGSIFHYDGTSWSAVTSPTTQNLVGVSAVSTSDVLLTGDAGTILRWNGTSFAVVTSPTTDDLMSVIRVGGVTYVTGWDGVLLRGL